MADQLETKFVAMDEASPKFAKMGDNAEKLVTKLEKAQRAVEKTGSAPTQATQHAMEKAAPAAERTQKVPAYLSGLGAAEQEEILEAKKSMLQRRARTRVAKIEMQQEMLMHRVAETSLMMMVDSQNQYAKGLTKIGTTGQMLGSSLYGLGGRAGALGGVLMKLGGYAAMAGVAVEGVSFVAELAGVDVEHLTHSLKNWAIANDKAIAYVHKLFENADYKKAQRRLEEEEKLGKMLTREAAQIGAMPVEESGEAMRAFKVSTLEAAQRIHEMSDGAVKLDDAYKQLMAAAAQTIPSMVSKMNAEAGVKDMLEKEARMIQSIPYGATIESQQAQNDLAASNYETIARNMHWTDAEAKAHFDTYMALVNANTSVVSATSKWAEDELVHDRMQLAEQEWEEQLKKMKLSGMALTATMYQQAPMIAEKFGLGPAQINEVLAHTKGVVSDMKKTKINASTTFNNARFDIRQNFAEGFDPDRIALAFSSDLARISDRQHQSGQVAGPSGI